MIPLADENPVGKKPYVVYVLLALNVVVFIVDLLGTKVISGIPINGLWDFSMLPKAVVTNQPVPVELHLNRGLLQVPHAGLTPQWLTIFTSMFLHGGWMHIIGNMLFLWIFGNNIEDAIGHFKFLLFYLACGALAAFAHIASNPGSQIPTVGASGAIAGVLGAYLLLYPRNNVRTLLMLGWWWEVVEIPAVLVLGVWFVTQFIGLWGTGGLVGGGVAYWAHIGGFAAGVVLILMLGGWKLRTPPRRGRLYRYDEDRPYPHRPWQ